MGKILQGILGGVSGKIAGVVGSSWKGIPVIKAKPLSVANPRTAGQVAQRGAFSQVVAFATLILATVIKPLWDRFAIRQSGYNAFVSTNIDNFDVDGIVDYSALIISKGKMASTAIGAITSADSDATVQISWVDDSGEGYKLATDEAYGVVINETGDTVGSVAAGAVRTAGTVSVELTANASTADTLHAYLAFRRSDGTVVSNTSYDTDVVPA